MQDRDAWTLASLAQLVARGKRLETLLEGRPALIVRHGAELGSPRINTPSQGIKKSDLRETAVHKVEGSETQVALAVSPLGEIAFPDNRVVSLIKSDRNPFSSMLTVGRAPNNDVCLHATEVSKIHAFLLPQADGSWLLEDNGSTNGTQVDGIPLTPKVRVSIASGAELEFAGVVVHFVDLAGLSLILSMNSGE